MSKSEFGEVKRNIVKSSARTLKILDLFIEEPEGMSFTEIRRKTGYPNSSLHDLLETLLYMNYLEKDDTTKKYILSYKTLQFNSVLENKRDLISSAEPVMKRLMESTNETTSLTILNGNEILFIRKFYAPGRIQIINPTGTRLPAHATGAGKVMLAHLENSKVDELYPEEKLPTLTVNTINSRTHLKRELSKIYNCGYAFDKEESAIGIWAVSGCIHSTDEDPAASLSIVGPISRIASKDTSEWPELVRRGALEISKSLRYNTCTE